MTREELFQMVELLRDTAKLHQPDEEILTNVKAESFVFVMESVLSALSENKGEWIPVTERLPLFGKYKVSDDVLITNGYEIDMGYLVERNGKIFWHYYGSDYEYGVKDEDNDAIAWQPLPEPYKAESEGK